MGVYLGGLGKEIGESRRETGDASEANECGGGTLLGAS